MKAYTNIEQSKKLAEILPVESADFQNKTIESNGDEDVDNVSYVIHPCWSLTALLGILPYPSLHKTFAGWRCDSYDKEGKTCKLGENADNPVDACYEMIMRLHELNLL